MKAISCLLIAFLLQTCMLSAQSLLPEVNLFLGTSGDHGQLAPAANVPFGMVQVCPDSHPRQHAGYDYAVPTISGISVNRLSGVGGQGCGGNLSLMPDTAGVDVRIVKSTEKAQPGYYHAKLSNGVNIELTATRTTAVERFTWQPGMQPVLLFAPASAFERVFHSDYQTLSSNEIGGTIAAANTCGNGRYTLYYYLHTDVPFHLEPAGNRQKLTFTEDSPVEVRIAVSPLSIEEARRCFLETSENDFQTIRQQAAEAWESILSRVEIKGGDKDERTLFYTSLFRTCQSPLQVTTGKNGEYPGTDGKLHRAEGFDYYSSWSLWDTYRTKFPLLTLIVPERMSDMMQSLAVLYTTGKRDWSTDAECVPTVRTEHAIALLLDSRLKGIEIPNLAEAYAGMKHEVANLPLKSPDQCMEASTDLWALSRVADLLDKPADAALYRRKGDSLFCTVWNREFRYVDSTYTRMRQNGLYQGTRWQYRWAAPQFLPQMIERVGKDSLEAQLTTFFAQNLYNQGNEPDIHVPYLFNRLGSPEKTQQTIFQLLTQPMTHIYGGNAEYASPYIGKAFKNAPEAYCPEMDEDDGAMSAWYVFSAMGLYPLIVGEPSYELVSPLFDETVLHLPAGKRFVIRTVGRETKEQPVLEIRLNNRQLSDYRISHHDIAKGGVLEFIYCGGNE